MDNKNTTSKLFGLKPVLLRKKNNLTQLQLSKEIGVDDSTFCCWGCLK